MRVRGHVSSALAPRGPVTRCLGVAKELYLRLFRELNAARFESAETGEAIARLGAPALLLRGIAWARRRRWSRARRDFQAALRQPPLAQRGEARDLIEYVGGIGLFVTRDYDAALHLLNTVSERGASALSREAGKLAVTLASGLGWAQEARTLRLRLAESAARRNARARAAVQRHRQQERERAQAALEGPPQQAAPRAAALLLHAGPKAAAAALDELLRRHPAVPELIAARVDLHLLLDEAEQAETLLSTTLADKPELATALRSERAATAVSLGAYREAMTLTEHPESELRLTLLRAELLMLHDDLGAAIELLEHARSKLPRSVPVVLALALARYRQDPRTHDESLERRFDDLVGWAPALLADAARSAEVELWTDSGFAPQRRDKVRVLVRARGLLTGERDPARPSYSCPSAGKGPRLRHLAPADRDGPSHLDRLHADDRQHLELAESRLIRVLEVAPPAPEVRDGEEELHPAEPAVRRPWTPRSLSPEQIEQFLRDGFLVVPQAFDRNIAAAWCADANRRIREAPEKWIRGYDPKDTRHSVSGYDPDDPTTWTRERIDLFGEETVRIADFAPRAWAAICDLLGGPERVETDSWTNYLIINYGTRPNLRSTQPKPDWSSWHIDDPSPTMRLDNIRNGLIGIALFSDLYPSSGNTWLAPDSVGHIVRELAAHPQGFDFCAIRGTHITRRCTRFHEVTGKAGDVLLLHPLMMHSASPNASERIRFMGNPMIYLRDTLDPFRPEPELSLVELAMRRALEADPATRELVP